MLSIYMGEYEGNDVRVTEDGRFSIYDVLAAFVKPTVHNGKQSKEINPTQLFKTITDKNPEVVQFSGKFK